MPQGLSWYSVAYGNGILVAIASSSNIAAYSEDGINWTQTTLPVSGSWHSVCYGNGKFVAIAYNSNVDIKIIYGRGLKGRIPPYLLKPISNITNISYVFYGCRALTCYTILEDSKSYLIPRDFFKYATKINR